MKSLMRIYVKYIATALTLVFIFLALQIGIMGATVVWLYHGGSEYGKYSIRSVYDALQPDDGQQEAVSRLMNMNASFAMLLDQAGQPVWSYRLPENLNHAYTVSEVASFSRWYLDDYPVSVWGGDKGLLLVGYPRGSIWNYHVRQKTDELTSFMTFFFLSFFLTILVAVVILLAAGYRSYRKMREMTDAIARLACGDSVHLPESGTMREVAAALNRTSDRLTGQRKQLEQRDEARTQWISGVSHDIRTPLSLVMGYAGMIENQPEADVQIRKRAALIRRQSIRIRDLIEDLNLTSKLEYNSQPLRLKPVLLAALLRKVAADLLNTMEQPHMYPFSIQIEPEFETCSMEGDEQLLFRAFRNILGNSIRHNENGCALEIRALMEHGRPRIECRDNGCGIPRSICRYLNEGILPENDIHIMGLRIVKQIVTAHGGEIHAQPDGQGITVRL